MKPAVVIGKLLEGFRRLTMSQGEPESLSPQESRTSPRIICSYRVQLKSGVQNFTASVVDIGTTGLRVEGLPEVQEGQVFEISYPYAGSGGAAFDVKAMWSRPGRDGERVAGFCFVKQGEQLKGTWIYPLLSELGLTGNAVFQKRKHLRLSVKRKVFLRDDESGRHLLVGRLSNLSVGGALVQSAFELEKGRRVVAIMGPSPDRPRLTIRAEVIGVKMDEDDGHRLISLRFVEMDDAQLKDLEQIIMEMLKGKG